jgi:hypothetical protein
MSLNRNRQPHSGNLIPPNGNHVTLKRNLIPRNDNLISANDNWIPLSDNLEPPKRNGIPANGNAESRICERPHHRKTISEAKTHGKRPGNPDLERNSEELPAASATGDF